MSTNRIGGDYNADALEAFRAAYANQMQTPEDLDIAANGLPGNEVSNTSPWLAHTGLWKANDGVSRDFKPNQPFNPDEFLSQTDGDDSKDEELGDEDFDAYLNSLSLDELQLLAEELGAGDDASDEDEEMSDEELDNLVAELMGEEG
jgi:hypothetical protein